MKHGMSGVGVYWCIVEMLYEEGGYLPFEYERISFELRTDMKIIESVINDFELFKNDQKTFWSESILDRLKQRCNKSEKARQSISNRWNKLENNTNVIRQVSKRNTIKKRKEKKSIVKNNIFIVPTIEEITDYCKERKNQINPQTFLDHYTGNGWMVGKNKMKDWKAVIRTWETRGGNNVTANTYQIQSRKMDTGQEQSLRNADRIREEYEAAIAASNGGDN
jgi:hypothetical protein